MKAQVSGTEKYKYVDPYEFHMAYLRADSVLMIDVREPFEFRGRHIHDAINLPYSVKLKSAADTISKRYVIFLYCTTGYRSNLAAEYLYEKGFRKLYSLDGGIVEWKKEGYPVERRRRK